MTKSNYNPEIVLFRSSGCQLGSLLRAASDSSSDPNSVSHWAYGWDMITWRQIQCNYGLNFFNLLSNGKGETCPKMYNITNHIPLYEMAWWVNGFIVAYNGIFNMPPKWAATLWMIWMISCMILPPTASLRYCTSQHLSSTTLDQDPWF